MGGALYRKQDDPRELAAFGLSPDDFPPVVVDIWPENEQAFDLFTALRTQWRIGFGGPTGLDYNVLHHRMDRLGLTPERYDELEGEVQILEHAALDELTRK